MRRWTGTRVIPTAALALAALLTAAAPAAAQTFRISTENDLLTDASARDDLYTFAVALELERPGHALSLRENAFTDRAAGIRFDETYLSVGRELATAGPWSVAGEVGLVHRGKGLFGENVQNAVHRAIGGEAVELRYLGSSLHPRLALNAERRFAAGAHSDWGPRLEADLVPGLRSWALVAAAASWRPSPRFALEASAGVRLTHASYAPLRPHLEPVVPAARIGLLFGERLFVSWSYGDYGEKREHLSAGYRLALDAGAARVRSRG